MAIPVRLLDPADKGSVIFRNVRKYTTAHSVLLQEPRRFHSIVWRNPNLESNSVCVVWSLYSLPGIPKLSVWPTSCFSLGPIIYTGFRLKNGGAILWKTRALPENLEISAPNVVYWWLKTKWQSLGAFAKWLATDVLVMSALPTGCDLGSPRLVPDEFSWNFMPSVLTEIGPHSPNFGYDRPELRETLP